VRIAGNARDAQGTIAWVEGRVSDTAGAPLSGALVEIWQCDVHGRYLKPADDAAGPRDDNFQGYGQLSTGADGASRFGRSGRCATRAPAAHSRAGFAPRHPRLVTQLYTSETGEAAPSGYERRIARCGLPSRRRRAKRARSLRASTSCSRSWLKARIPGFASLDPGYNGVARVASFATRDELENPAEPQHRERCSHQRKRRRGRRERTR
jgi:hypothetical protein